MSAFASEHFEVNQDDDVHYVQVHKYSRGGGFSLVFFPNPEENESNHVILHIKGNTLRIYESGKKILFVDKFTGNQCELFINYTSDELYVSIGKDDQPKLIFSWECHTGEELIKALKIINNYEKNEVRLRLTTAGVMTKGLSKAAGRDFLSDPGGNLSRHVAEYAGLKSPRSPKSPK